MRHTGSTNLGPWRVCVIMGSESDWTVMQHTCITLQNLALPYSAHIASSHRTPARVKKLVSGAEKKGYQVVICGAGLSAALPGDAAARTNLPVIGVAMPGQSKVDKLVAILSMTKMPPGTPVSFAGVGKPGAINAALNAARMIGIADLAVRKRMQAFRTSQAKKVPKHPPALSAQS